MKYFYILLSLLFTLNACKLEDSGSNISFYHWKTNAEYTKPIAEVLNQTNTKHIYLRYFDIEYMNSSGYNYGGVYPNYVIKKIDEEYKDYEIIPTIYIANDVLYSNDLDIQDLIKKIAQLTNQISVDHFKTNFTKIQIDCDWTVATRNKYFEILEGLNSFYDVSATIRLHQIKFQEKTGIPPVKYGALMLYNVGDLKDVNQNSILESEIVAQYINNSSTYPLKLSIALPLFSQTVIFNADNNIKLSSFTERQILENDLHFKKLNQNLYTVVQDTLFKGFYLSEGFQLKLEESLEKEIVESYKIVKNSNLKTGEIIFYHLDDESLKNININNLINAL